MRKLPLTFLCLCIYFISHAQGALKHTDDTLYCKIVKKTIVGDTTKTGIITTTTTFYGDMLNNKKSIIYTLQVKRYYYIPTDGSKCDTYADINSCNKILSISLTEGKSLLFTWVKKQSVDDLTLNLKKDTDGNDYENGICVGNSNPYFLCIDEPEKYNYLPSMYSINTSKQLNHRIVSTTETVYWYIFNN
jgi:hypothetical protein